MPWLPFPAGRTKLAAVEVTRLVDPADVRLRIRTTMRFFWDRVFLGMERPVPYAGDPPWFVDPQAPLEGLEADWIAPVGPYTRYGEVPGLLDVFDDRYAILGPGDGVEVEFDLPPPALARGRRTLLARVAGYCKDAHPGTFTSATVAPLPYRGMPVLRPGETWPSERQESVWRSIAALTTRYRGPRPGRGQAAGPGAIISRAWGHERRPRAR